MMELSLASMDHDFLQELELLPFDMIRAVDYDGTDKVYTLEEFRRLYNDALETILAYHKAAIHYRQVSERCRKLYEDTTARPKD